MHRMAWMTLIEPLHVCILMDRHEICYPTDQEHYGTHNLAPPELPLRARIACPTTIWLCSV